MLERGFLSARAEIESGAYDFGASDDEQNFEVGGALLVQHASDYSMIILCY